MKRYKAAIVGATGAVGQKYAALLARHPFFSPTVVAASFRSAGKTYRQAIEEKDFPDKEAFLNALPQDLKNLTVLDAEADFQKIVRSVDVVFCAFRASEEAVKSLETRFALAELPVVSNNAAHRPCPDVPIVIPEINPEHLAVIPYQKKRLGTKRGFIATKSNCSLLSYLPLLHPLRKFGLKEAAVCTYQAVSGAGKTLQTMPQIEDNVVPYIAGEEEKSQTEPLKIWGKCANGEIRPTSDVKITAQCVRVPVSEGHLAAIFARFETPPKREEILRAWNTYEYETQKLALHSEPKRFISYFNAPDRPQPRLDKSTGDGMTVCAGRLRKDCVFDWKFFGLSHNAVRGAAGGAILLAELLAAKGLLD